MERRRVGRSFFQVILYSFFGNKLEYRRRNCDILVPTNSIYVTAAGADEKTLPIIVPSCEENASPLSEDVLNVSASFEKLRVDLSAETPSPQDVTISNLVGSDASPNNDIDKLFDKIYLENSSETGSQSEGDTSSSGGREIQRIIGCGNHSSPTEKRDKTIG